MKDRSYNSGAPWIIKGMMITGAILMIAAATGMFLIHSSPRGQVNASGGPLRVGMKMPDFSLPDLHGKPSGLRDYSGRVVLINAWATWCPPCKAEMPALNSLYLKNRDSGFVLLAVNAGETKAQASAFADRYGLQFPILLDEKEQLMDQLGIRDYPTSILVGKDGVIQWVHVGLLTAEQIENEVQPWITP